MNANKSNQILKLILFSQNNKLFQSKISFKIIYKQQYK